MAEWTSLGEPPRDDVGGKARGLMRLAAAGFDVPVGWVCADPGAAADLPAEVGEGTWAVRSSARSEDGAAASFAGQFESFLGVRGRAAIAENVAACAASARAARVAAYAEGRGADLRVAVVVQRMVEAAWAGVLFTVDPVTGRRDRRVIEAVPGVAEALVAGEVEGVRVALDREGAVREGAGTLPEALVAALADGAARAEAAFGEPVDLEWAADADGRLWWLQARPITSPMVVARALDALPEGDGGLLTRHNVGEMMPGAVTPLTWSVFARGIDVGLQDFMVASGHLPGRVGFPHYVHMAGGHLFLSLSRLYLVARDVAFAVRENIDLAIVGRVLDEPPVPTAPSWTRGLNFARQLRWLGGWRGRIRALEALCEVPAPEPRADARALLAWLEVARDRVVDAWAHHYCTSSRSGTLYTAALRIAGGGALVPTPATIEAVAACLTGIEDVESAHVVRSLDDLARAIHATDGALDALHARDDAEAARWLEHEAPHPICAAFRAFLERHGHRALREAELRTPSWRRAPERIVPILRAGARPPAPPPRPWTEAWADLRATLPFGARIALDRLLPMTREAVAARERTKALAVRVQSVVSETYERLGAALAATGRLDDPDQIWFLQHEEVREVVGGSDLRARAEARRRVLPLQMDLEFPEICRGVPMPGGGEPHDGDLVGVPIGQGRAEGRAVVCDTLEDAVNLGPGDVLVTRTTDVGWTPWFRVAGGLVTEVGSTLSHGAVVAREYGLPAVVGVRGAREALRHGPRVLLDGTRGTVSVLDGQPTGPA